MPALENFRLRVFRSVAKHLNFSRAGEELLLTQPAVTQQIKALENELDAILFDRGGGRIQLTAAGRTLLTFAEKISLLSEEAVQAVAEVAGERSGELELGASQTIAQYVLPDLIAAFRRSHPKVHITAVSGNTVTLLLTDGGLGDSDLAVNGAITDPGGAAVPVGGAAGIPTLGQGAAALLSLLLAAVGFRAGRTAGAGRRPGS